MVSYQKPRETVYANVIGTTNLLESIKKVKSVKSVIIVTTDKVYLNLEQNKKFKENEKLGGYDIYSSSKAACDIIAESYIKSFFLILIAVFQLSDLGIVSEEGIGQKIEL